MDPNTTLSELLSLLAEAESYEPTSAEWQDTASEIMDTFRDLDQWLRSGGFLPMAWGERK